MLNAGWHITTAYVHMKIKNKLNNMMENLKDENFKIKTKNLRRQVIRTFLLLFTPHLLVCLLTVQVTINPIDIMKWQLCWFLTYFTISFLVYVFAPKILKKWN